MTVERALRVTSRLGVARPDRSLHRTSNRAPLVRRLSDSRWSAAGPTDERAIGAGANRPAPPSAGPLAGPTDGGRPESSPIGAARPLVGPRAGPAADPVRRPVARDARSGGAGGASCSGDGPDPRSRAARAPGARPGVRTDVLQPLEEEFERAVGGSRGSRGATSARPRSRPDSRAARCRGRSAARAGRSWSRSSSTSSSGQVTGGLWSYIPGAYNALVHATPEQRERYLDPSLRGERSGSYAVTEEAPAPTPERSRRPRCGTRQPATTSSTARSGSSPAPTTPIS